MCFNNIYVYWCGFLDILIIRIIYYYTVIFYLLINGKPATDSQSRENCILVMMKGKLFQCTKCSLAYASRKCLTWHKEADHGFLSLKCQHCPGVFTNKDNLDEHNFTHFGQQTYKCPKCPSVFTLKAFLRLHENAHININTFKSPKEYSLQEVGFKFNCFAQS